MVFGKRKRDDLAYAQAFEDDEDMLMHDYEEFPNSDDEDIEEIKVVGSGHSGSAETNNFVQSREKRLDPNSKPLLDEVIMKGIASGKNPGGAKHWECKHCKATFVSTYTRIHTHFFGAPAGKKAEIKRCPALLKDRTSFEKIRKKVECAEKEGVSSALKNSKLTHRQAIRGKGLLEESFALMDRHAVDSTIVSALCANGIPFNVLRNPQFCRRVTAINRGPKGYKAPSFEKARTSLLDEVKTSVEKELIPVKDTWYTDGVSIVSDGWSNVRKNPLINILAVNSRGAMFLYAEDYSGVEKSGVNIAKLLLKAIDEVGPSNVIQVVTDNAANCKLAGKEVEKVHPHIFWSPCVVHTLNLIFKDLAQAFDWFQATYSQGKNIVKYFINHSHALTIFRAHSKLELLKVAKTRFASHYIMLKRLVDVREALATTVVLNSWKDLMKNGDENSRTIGAIVTGYIGSDDFWDEVHNILIITKPIYKLIRFCDKDGPIMGEIYEGMDNMLGEIKDALKGNKYEDAFEKIEVLVLGRWEKMNVPMHCLGFALSPRFYDSTYISTIAPGGTTRKRPNEDKEVVSGVLKAFEKIASDPEEA
ncbi:hypothetical protein U1Q18_052716 [Sarracenia purpurea var. burkii]